MIQENNHLLTVKEVTKILRVSRPKLNALRKDGKIKAVLVGESVRFTEDEITRFINESVETQAVS